MEERGDRFDQNSVSAEKITDRLEGEGRETLSRHPIEAILIFTIVIASYANAIWKLL